jgi:hypothetical protein
MKAYRLIKDIPGLEAGAVFVHDKHDSKKGSIGAGCLKLAWDDHNCQQSWCAETHILPGQLASDTEWFVRIKNHKKYTVK